ncbi:hypothetical protein N8506_03045 [Synechococcus sp. AH-601-N23]|nr:hypothetical protein [Synechococcus sp. AH-601-N23]
MAMRTHNKDLRKKQDDLLEAGMGEAALRVFRAGMAAYTERA